MIEKTFVVEDLVSSILEANPINFSLNLLFGESTIQVLSNSNILIDKLTNYYKDFIGSNGQTNIVITAIEMESLSLDLSFTVKQPDPGKTKIKEEYINFPNHRLVRKKLTDMLFLFGGDLNLAVGPCVKNDNQVINFINNRYIQWMLYQNCLLGHASAVVWKGRGLAIAGTSGAGKSSLALHLMDHGLTFISNDRLLIRKKNNRLEMFGVPKLPRVNPGTVLNNPKLISTIPSKERTKFSKLSSEELWDLEYKYDVFIDKCFGENKFDLFAPMNGLVILNWKRKDISMSMRQVDLGKRRDLLPAFVKSPGLFFELNPEKEIDFSNEVYINHLKKCSVFEIKGGVDFDKAAKDCLTFLEGELDANQNDQNS